LVQDPELQDHGPELEATVANELANNEDNDGDIVAGPTVVAYVHLAKTASMCHLNIIITNTHTTAASRTYPNDLAAEIDQHNLNFLIQKFLYAQTNSQSSPSPEPEGHNLPSFDGKITIYPSAVAIFYSPSDISGVGGMRSERIRAVKSWRRGPPRHDCIFVETDPNVPGMAGLDIARVRLFFSCTFNRVKYPCALVHWFSRVNQSADPETGMWVVEPDFTEDNIPITSVIHLDTIIRAAHLLPVFKGKDVSRELLFSDTLNEFESFYVNKFVDHHAFEIAF
jgi:hypothetical protein